MGMDSYIAHIIYIFLKAFKTPISIVCRMFQMYKPSLRYNIATRGKVDDTKQTLIAPAASQSWYTDKA